MAQSPLVFHVIILHVIRKKKRETSAPAASFPIPWISIETHQMVSLLSWRMEKLAVKSPFFVEFSVTHFCKHSPFLVSFTSLATRMGHQLSGEVRSFVGCFALVLSSTTRNRDITRQKIVVRPNQGGRQERPCSSPSPRLQCYCPSSTYVSSGDGFGTTSPRDRSSSLPAGTAELFRTFDKLHHQAHRRD